jgi:hypothetical protein
MIYGLGNGEGRGDDEPSLRESWWSNIFLRASHTHQTRELVVKCTSALRRLATRKVRSLTNKPLDIEIVHLLLTCTLCEIQNVRILHTKNPRWEFELHRGLQREPVSTHILSASCLPKSHSREPTSYTISTHPSIDSNTSGTETSTEFSRLCEPASCAHDTGGGRARV